MRLISIISILLMPAILICACPVEAVEHDDPVGFPQSNLTAPRVGETRVVPTTFIPDPFVNTQAALLFGYGQSSDFVTPVLEINGDPVLGLEGDLLYVIVGFEYRYAVRDWVAVWARINVAARLGNEVQAILAQGVSAANSFELGWLFRLYETEGHLLSTGISVKNGSTTLVDIIGWTNGVIEGEDVGLVRSSPTLSTIGDLRYAYAANDYIALQLSGQLSYGEAVDRSIGNDWYYGLGGVVSFDLAKKTGTPVGLAFGYKISSIPEGGDDITERAQSILVGLCYMGRPDFGIGLDLQFQRVPIRGVDDPAKFFSAVISSQYFF